MRKAKSYYEGNSTVRITEDPEATSRRDLAAMFALAGLLARGYCPKVGEKAIKVADHLLKELDK